MFFVKNAYCKLWEIEVLEKYAKGRISTSDKTKTGDYINSNWFATFVGKAKDKAEQLEGTERLNIITGKVSNVGRKQDDGNYKNFTGVTIFDFEVMDGNTATAHNANVETVGEEDLPF